MHLQPVVVVVALIRRGDDVLLVEQQGPDEQPAWVLPGGVAESGELLVDTLRREVQEEAGLQVLEVGPLIYTVQMDDAQNGVAVLAFCFGVPAWQGDVNPADPDHLILQARFVPPAEAIRLLDALPRAYVSHPSASYLRGDAGLGAVWLYRRDASGADRLQAHLPGATLP